MKAAQQWIRSRSAETYVSMALQAVGGMLASAGPKEEATRLSGLAPADRAQVAIARLRDAQVPPERILACWLALESLIASDPNADQRLEFKRVQVAKVVHRLASGTHRKWVQSGPSGTTRTLELHRYPASRGRVLRHLGARLERACEFAVDLWLSEIKVEA